MRYSEAVTKYIDFCRSRGLRDHVIKAKARHLGYFRCDKNIEDITFDNLTEFINSLDFLGEDPKFRTVQDLRMFFKFLSELQLSTVPWSLIRYKAPESEPITAMTYDEFRLVDEGLKKLKGKKYIRQRAIHNILWSLGCRRGELINIELSNVDLNNGRVFFKAEKGNGFRVGKFFTGTEPVKEYIRIYKPKKYLFPICSNMIANEFYDYKKRFELRDNLSLHSYRSGLITWLHLVKGVSLKIIQEYIGHRKLDTTASYVRNDTETILSKIGDCFVPEKKAKGEFSLLGGMVTIEAKYKKNQL